MSLTYILSLPFLHSCSYANDKFMLQGREIYIAFADLRPYTSQQDQACTKVLSNWFFKQFDVVCNILYLHVL